MGFFKDFKDDFSQAVNELLPDDVFTDSDEELLFKDDEVVDTLDNLDLEKESEDKRVSASEQERVDKIDANVEAFLQKVKALDEGKNLGEENDFKMDDVMTTDDEMLFADVLGTDIENDQDEELISYPVESEDEGLLDNRIEPLSEEDLSIVDSIDEEEVDSDITFIDVEEDTMITEIANEKDQKDDIIGLQEVKEERGVASSDVTVIGKSTVINGSVNSGGGLEVYGKVEGDIECGGKLTINGVVKGNSKAQEVFVNAKRLEGNVESTGSIKVGQGTVVIGDINASAGVIAGAIKGQIDVSGAVILDSTAIVKGNIKAKSVQINNGAVVDGYCSLVYADVDLENVFDED